VWILCCSSRTFVNLSSHIFVLYTQGSWSGFLGTDLVNITSIANLTAFRANIAMMTQSKDFFVNGSKWQGILGLAFSEIAQVSCFCCFFLVVLVFSSLRAYVWCCFVFLFISVVIKITVKSIYCKLTLHKENYDCICNKCTECGKIK